MSISLSQRVALVARARGTDALLVAALAALTLYVRWTTLEPIENGGDPLDNWYFVRQWAYENDPAHARLDHHASRFGIHWITWVAQSLLGTHPRVYYVPQLFASTLCTVLTYALGRQISGRTVGLVSALLLLECPPFVSASSQLRPAIFETMYALAAAVCLLRFIDRTGRVALAWLSASATLVFLAYLSHEPDAFLVPGMMLVVWLKRRDYRDLLVFVGVLGGLVLVETAAYAIFTQYWGRIEVLRTSHLTRPGPPRTFEYLFERFTKAGDALKLAYYPFFVAAPILVVLAKSLKERAIVFIAGGFLFLATFFVRSFDPLIVFMQHRDRYILVTVPFAYIATSHCLVIVAKRLIERFRASVAPFPLRVPRLVIQVVAWLSAGALMTAVGVRASESVRRAHPFRSIDAIYLTLNDAYRRQLPIIAGVSRRKPNYTQVRALHWAHKGFLRDEFFVVDGRLRNFSYRRDLAVLSRNERYLPKTPELDVARVREVEKTGCAIRLRTRGTFVELSSRKRLSKRCRP